MPEPRPIRRQPGHPGHPVRLRRVGHDGALGRLIPARFGLKEIICGEPAVDLRESDVHGDVAGGQTGGVALPNLARGTEKIT